MSPTPLTLLVPCLLMSCCATMAQSPRQEDLPSATTQAKPDSVQAAEEPRVSLLPLNHADAKDIAESISKIYDAQIKSGQLAIVGDSRANRLLIRTSERVYDEISQLIEELDIPTPVKQKSTSATSASSQPSESSVPADELKVLQIVQQMKQAAGDRSKVESLQVTLTALVEEQFVQQQIELRSELAKLRAKADELAVLLDKRERHKKVICLDRINSFFPESENLGQRLKRLSSESLQSSDAEENAPKQ